MAGSQDNIEKTTQITDYRKAHFAENENEFYLDTLNMSEFERDSIPPDITEDQYVEFETQIMEDLDDGDKDLNDDDIWVLAPESMDVDVMDLEVGGQGRVVVDKTLHDRVGVGVNVRQTTVGNPNKATGSQNSGVGYENRATQTLVYSGQGDGHHTHNAREIKIEYHYHYYHYHYPHTNRERGGVGDGMGDGVEPGVGGV